jgi:phosphatidylcholine synthase
LHLSQSPTARQSTNPKPLGPSLLHLFTATGALCGLFSLLAISDHSPRAALVWMIVAVIIDAVDGPIARKLDVAIRMPMIDGNSLDLVIDYVTCVLAPSMFIYEFELLPKPQALALTGLICLTSLFSFARCDLMTDDNYFRGFPAMWNLVAAMMFVLQSRDWVNVIATIALVALTLLPVRVPHPIRTRHYREITVPVTLVWLTLLTVGVVDTPSQHAWIKWPLVAGTVYFVAVSAERTRRGDAAPLAQASA